MVCMYFYFWVLFSNWRYETLYEFIVSCLVLKIVKLPSDLVSLKEFMDLLQIDLASWENKCITHFDETFWRSAGWIKEEGGCVWPGAQERMSGCRS